MKRQTYDLEERLLEYSVRIIRIVEKLPSNRTINHVAGQLLRLEETEELIRIFVASIKTAEKKANQVIPVR